MEEIGAYDAKTHLPRLLARVLKGERFVITKHGRPVAELGPIVEQDSRAIGRALSELRASRKRLAKQGVTLADLVGTGGRLRDFAHEGHRR